MPRIYTSTSDPIDFCSSCFPDEETAEQRYGNIGDGPDDRGNCYAYDAEQPPFNEFDGYQCDTCRKTIDSDGRTFSREDLRRIAAQNEDRRDTRASRRHDW